MDVSRLGIIVESKGIDEAAAALRGKNGRGGLAAAADKAEASVLKLTQTMQKLLNVNASATTMAWAASLGSLNTVLGQATSLANNLANSLQGAATGFNGFTNSTNQSTSAGERHNRTTHVMLNTIKAMTTAFSVYSAVNFAKSIISQADSWQLLNSRLQNATGSIHNATVAQNEMFQLSQRLRVPLEESVKLYTRLAPAMQRAGKDAGYTKDMVEGIATALQLGGANGAETSSVMLQLSQSFSSGVLNGAEFNAVAENGSVLMRALEKSTGLSTSELKKLGSQGKLTMSVVGKAIQDNLPAWREQFDKLPLTFEGAMQRLQNAWTKAVGEMGQDTGFNSQLAKSLGVIEAMIPAVARGLGDAFINLMNWVNKNREGISKVFDAVIDIGKATYLAADAFLAVNAQVLETGNSASVLALALRGIGLLVTGIVDGVSLIYSAALGVAGAFVAVGAAIQGIVTGPLFLLLKGMQKYAEFNAWMSNDPAAKKLASDFEEAANGVAKSQANTTDLMNSLFSKSDAILQRFRSGSTATKQFLDGIGTTASTVSKTLVQTQGDLRKFENSMSMDPGAWGANPNPKGPVDSKGQAAAAKATELFEKQVAEAKAAVAQQEELNNRLKTYGAEYEKLGPMQKKVIEMQEQLKNLESGKAQGTALQISRQKELLSIYQEAANLERGNERTKQIATSGQETLNKEQTVLKTLREEVQAIEDKVAAYGKAKGAAEDEALARTKQRLADVQSIPEDLQTPEHNALVALLQEEVSLMEQKAAAANKLGQLQAADEFDKLMDPKKAEKFADTFTTAFGKIGKGVGGVVKALQNWEARQSKVKKAWELVNKQTDPAIRAKEAEQAYSMETESRLASYADMTGAAKEFFGEHTAMYKGLEAAEKAFRLFQMAMQVKAFLQEMGFITGLTSATVAGEAAKSTATVDSATTSIAASQAEGTASAAAAVANQGKGDPYSAFVRIAAMVAIMAALGFAVGGGGNANVSQQRQASQGTGTVLGAYDQKSESIAKSISLLADNSDISLRYTSEMLTSLQNIEYSLTGATSGVIRSGSALGKDFQTSTGVSGVGKVLEPIGSILSGIPVLGGLINTVIGALFGSKTTLKDSGISGSSQSVQDILSNGFNVKAYQDVNTKKKAFGITYSSKNKTQYSALDPAVANQFGLVVSGMVDSLVSAAQVLGMSGDAVKAKLEAVNIDIGKISLKGLSGDEVQKQLEAVFSAIGDNLTAVAIPAVTKFQKAGEGLLETAVRVATGVEQAQYELDKLGIAAVDFSQIQNTGGDVAAEIVRQSIVSATSGGIKDIISTFSGEASDIASTYSALVKAKNGLLSLGIASDISRDLIRAAGGLSALQDALDSYTTGYFSQAEQNAMSAKSLQAEFTKLGLTMPKTKADFRALVDTLSSSGASGQELATKVLLLSDSFAALADNVTSAYNDNVDAARSNLTDAYDRESQALEDVKSKFEDLVKSLGDFKSSLLTGDNSTLTVQQKYMQAALDYQNTLAAAQAGDSTAMANFQSVAETFLSFSRQMYASGAQYTTDFNNVYSATSALQSVATTQVDVAQQQLDTLKSQVEGLIDINDSVLSVADAIAALQSLLSNGVSLVDVATGDKKTIMPVVNGSHADGLGYVPFDGYVAELHKGEAVLTATENRAYQMDYSQYGRNSDEALVNEIKALREQVKVLTENQQAQTSAIIASNYDANDRNAKAIVEGSKEVADSANYKERAKVTLV